jgi:hypothetical protein
MKAMRDFDDKERGEGAREEGEGIRTVARRDHRLGRAEKSATIPTAKKKTMAKRPKGMCGSSGREIPPTRESNDRRIEREKAERLQSVPPPPGPGEEAAKPAQRRRNEEGIFLQEAPLKNEW